MPLRVISPSIPRNMSCDYFRITNIQMAHPESGASSTLCFQSIKLSLSNPFYTNKPGQSNWGDFLNCWVKAIENKWWFWSSPLKQLVDPKMQTHLQPHSVINSFPAPGLRGGKCNPLSWHALMKTHTLHHPKLSVSPEPAGLDLQRLFIPNSLSSLSPHCGQSFLRFFLTQPSKYK